MPLYRFEKCGLGVRLVQEGRRTTRAAALKWERQQTEKGRPTRK